MRSKKKIRKRARQEVKKALDLVECQSMREGGGVSKLKIVFYNKIKFSLLSLHKVFFFLGGRFHSTILGFGPIPTRSKTFKKRPIWSLKDNFILDFI